MTVLQIMQAFTLTANSFFNDAMADSYHWATL